MCLPVVVPSHDVLLLPDVVVVDSLLLLPPISVAVSVSLSFFDGSRRASTGSPFVTPLHFQMGTTFCSRRPCTLLHVKVVVVYVVGRLGTKRPPTDVASGWQRIQLSLLYLIIKIIPTNKYEIKIPKI